MRKVPGKHEVNQPAEATTGRLTSWTAVLGFLAAGLSVLAVVLPWLVHLLTRQ
jgi:hypothetical protein